MHKNSFWHWQLVNVRRLFSSSMTLKRNNIASPWLAHQFSKVRCLQVRKGLHYLKSAPLWKLQSQKLTNIRLGWNGILETLAYLPYASQMQKNSLMTMTPDVSVSTNKLVCSYLSSHILMCMGNARGQSEKSFPKVRSRVEYLPMIKVHSLASQWRIKPVLIKKLPYASETCVSDAETS